MTNLKEAAAREAVKLVEDDMVVGLGSGSTASIAIKLLGERVRKEGLNIIGVPTSKESEVLGRSVGIKIGQLRDHKVVDLTIDGADEVDPELNLTKGLGGALVREKIVAAATAFEVITVDESKLVEHLGQKAPLPVEIVQFGHEATIRKIEKLGCQTRVRIKDGAVFISDNGNYIVDCRFSDIFDPAELERDLNMIPGVVDNGLFVGIASKVIVATKDGIRILDRKA